MKKTTLLLLAALALAVAAQAQNVTCNQIGGTTYCSGSDGSSAVGNRIGNTTYWNVRPPTPPPAWQRPQQWQQPAPAPAWQPTPPRPVHPLDPCYGNSWCR